MATIVTALLYSGRPNPTWELSSEEEDNLEALFIKDKGQTLELSAASLGILGYKGFIIESRNDSRSLPYKSFVFNGILDTLDASSANFIDNDSELENFLLATGSKILDFDEQSYINEEVRKNVFGGAASRNKSLTLLAAPPFNPAKWNKDPGVLRNNNCYNYGNDKITNTFAQPGRGSGTVISGLDCNNVSAAATRDGQISIPNVNSTPADGHYMALVIWPGRDYHWYRRDEGNYWSHKPGQTPARNTDNTGSAIISPEICDRGPYTIFCGYFHSIPSQTKIL